LGDGCDNVLYYTYYGNFTVTGLVKTDGSLAELYAYGTPRVLDADGSADADEAAGGLSGTRGSTER
jgi:hypothetical protein